MNAEAKTILRLEVPLIVQLGARTMHIKEVLSLAPGAILELTKTAEEELDVMVNNRRIGAGIAVKIGENFGIRITAIGPARERLQAATGVLRDG